ncbi:putative ribonuclease H-like domain-containing protein [Tanacetum coccineum]|uniref:Ribonuclease H-like domain-containing protein n=1 Tax=Tanacetum coccineum TaxID=301880 RepID=A0ABQ5JC76_9ASTR
MNLICSNAIVLSSSASNCKFNIFSNNSLTCFKCPKTGHFARECRTKEENRRRDGWNTGNREGRRTSNRDESISGKKEESRALVTVDGECVDWTTHSEDNDNYAFMANNSTGIQTLGQHDREQTYLLTIKTLMVALLHLEASRGYFTGKGKYQTGMDKRDIAMPELHNKWVSCERKEQGPLLRQQEPMLADSFFPNTFWAEADNSTNQNEGSKEKLIQGILTIEDESAQDCFEVLMAFVYFPQKHLSSKQNENEKKSKERKEQVFWMILQDFNRQESIPTSKSLIHLILQHHYGDPTSQYKQGSKSIKFLKLHAFDSYVQKQRRPIIRTFIIVFWMQKALDSNRICLMERRLSGFTERVYGIRKMKEESVVRNKLDYLSNGCEECLSLWQDCEEVYGLNHQVYQDPKYPQKVYKVVKALYGLHQAPRAWYATLSTFLLKNGYRRGTIDKTLFLKKDKHDIILVQVQTEKPKYTIRKTQKHLVKDEEASDVDVFKHFQRTSHLTAVKRIFRYLKGKPKLGLWYPRESTFDLESYSDSDYAGENLDRKSTTGAQLIAVWKRLKENGTEFHEVINFFNEYIFLMRYCFYRSSKEINLKAKIQSSKGKANLVIKTLHSISEENFKEQSHHKKTSLKEKEGNETKGRVSWKVQEEWEAGRRRIKQIAEEEEAN